MTDEELEEIRRRKLEELKRTMNQDVTTKEMPNGPVVVTDATIDETINKYPVVAVDCWAIWCAPCIAMEPVIEELAKSYHGKVVFGKLNVDENPMTTTKFGIMAIPTLLVFHNGNLVEQVRGAMPAPMLQPTIDKYV